MKLVVVESPTKAKTITRFLGNGVQVIASQGHIRDLPDHKMGVDVENGFQMDYELTGNGKRIVPQLRKAAKNASEIYLATDPDREGEAIAWHLQEVLRTSTAAPFQRITFHEITNTAIQNSLSKPGRLDMDMVDAQQARRAVDRIVGYQVSPMLWHSIHGATSAGRVQTVALRLVVEREREILAFVPVESWNLEAVFETAVPQAKFKARLAKINGANIKISDGETAKMLADAVSDKSVTHKVLRVTTTPRTKNPPPPFITSTLQQSAGSNLGFGASMTMRVAQELYEGIDLGNGQVGLITYMRTDSFNIAREAQDQARNYIAATFGPDYVPLRPNVYRSGKNAQEAHEAIRPTDMNNAPDKIAAYLTPQQRKLYTLIWNRFLASQMSPARQNDHAIEVESQGGKLLEMTPNSLVANEAKLDVGISGVACIFRASARETVFPGFLKAYNFKEIGEEDDAAATGNVLPKLPENTPCGLKELNKEQSFSQPPPRYTEASLVKALEQNGVGRPSTYATTVNTIQERNYVDKEHGSLKPTELGSKVCDFLVDQVKTLFEVKFTANLETELDQIEEGKRNWIDMLNGFYRNFQDCLGMKQMDASSPLANIVKDIMANFPPDFQYDEPVQKGSRKYDDAKFMQSIRERVENNKAMTDRQWHALLVTAAKYGKTHPEIMACLERNDLMEEVTPLLEGHSEASNVETEPVQPEVLALFEAMKKVEFKPAARGKGKRVYDDGKFVKSLQRQAKGGKALSVSQVRALLSLAGNYAASIPNFQELSSALSATIGGDAATAASQEAEAAPANPQEHEQLAKLLAMVDEIKEWKEGNGRFDDRTFAQSVREQFKRKGTLSPRQVSAIRRMLGSYISQIENGAERLGQAEASKVKAPLKVSEEVCPNCGSHLVERHGKHGAFLACPGYPKCRYIKK